MRRFRVLCPALAAGLVFGCGSPPPVGPGSVPTPSLAPTSLARRYAEEPTRPPTPARPDPLAVRGGWVPSGWMGDVAALSFRAVPGDPPADEWTYRPDRGSQGWVAVGYQWPDSIFGDRPGRNLAGRGYDRLVVQGRSVGDAPIRVVIKSGGHTAAGARHPATYEVETEPIALDGTWRDVVLPLDGRDLGNVPVALVAVFTELGCPRGAVVQLRSAAFR
jgi:hypothetical protein